MKAKLFLWIFLGLGILLLAWPLSQATSDDIGYVKSIIAVLGFVLMFAVWRRGKGLNEAAIDIGMSIAKSSRQKNGNETTASAEPVPQPFAEPPAKPTTPRKPSLPPERNRGVFLYRKPRSEGDVSRIGTSWVGGLPALGQVDWPRDTNGVLMHHVMQIDLREAGTFLDVPGLPKTGSLGVFSALGGEAATFETKICFVPDPAGETEPPDPLEPIGDHTYGGHYIRGEDPELLGTLPRWAVDLVCVETSGNLGTLRDELSAVRPLGDGMNIGINRFAASLPNGAKPSYWHSAQIFARSFDQAVSSESAIRIFGDMAAKAEANLRKFEAKGFPPKTDRTQMQEYIERNSEKVARLTAAKPELERVAEEMMRWALAHDPWSVMSAEDVARLETYFALVSQDNTEANICYRSSSNNHFSINDLASTTLKVMVTGPDAVFRMLPTEIRDAVDADYLVTDKPHQLFGPPDDIQATAYEFEADHMLVQIAHDDLMGLRLGDVGHIQVWLSPDELARGNLSAAVSTFECH